MLKIKFKKSQYIIGNLVEFMHHLRSRYPLYHLSNVFFRDLHYGVMGFLSKKGAVVSYSEAEKVAREVAVEFERKNIFKSIDRQTWMLNYPDFAAKKAS